MNKKALWILLCVSNNGVGMNQLLTLRSESFRKTIQDNREQTSWHNEYLSQRFLESMEGGDCVLDKSILDELPESVRQSCVQKALLKIIGSSQYKSVEFLLANNASPHVLPECEDCPLHVVRDSRIAQLLIDHGAWIEKKNDRGETPFFKAMKNSCFDIARTLYASGANVNQGDKEKCTPLHHAVIDSDPEKIKFLLYHGADANRRNNRNQTAGQMAGKQGRNILAAMREYRKVFCAINATVENNIDLTVMSLLAHNGRQLKEFLMLDSSGYCSSNIVIAETLLKQCDDKIWDELASGLSPYSLEVLFLVKLVKERSNHREFFLEALRSDDFSTAKELLKINPYLLHIYEGEYKSDLANDLFIAKLLFVPASDSKYCHIKEMIHCGFNFNVCNEDGMSLLCMVIANKHGDKYLDLLKAGVRVNIQDNERKTPIFYAAKLCNKDMVLKLLSYGAAVNKDLYQQFPVQHSMKQVMHEMYEEQKCFKCETHHYDLSNIPCVNRHLKFFICTKCYDTIGCIIRDKVVKKCLMCRRRLGVFGS